MKVTLFVLCRVGVLAFTLTSLTDGEDEPP